MCYISFATGSSSLLVWIGMASFSACSALPLPLSMLFSAQQPMGSCEIWLMSLCASPQWLLFFSSHSQLEPKSFQWPARTYKIWSPISLSSPHTHGASSLYPKCLSSGMFPLPAEIPQVYSHLLLNSFIFAQVFPHQRDHLTRSLYYST